MQVKTRDITSIALFTAIIFVLSLVKFSVGPVPITLQTLGVMLAGILLGSRNGFLATSLYTLLLFPRIAGPTGGFLIAFPIAALLIGLMVEKYGRDKWTMTIACVLFGIIFIYAVGTPWFKFVTGFDWKTSFSYAVLPFILGDFLKVLLAVTIVDRIPMIPLINNR